MKTLQERLGLSVGRLLRGVLCVLGALSWASVAPAVCPSAGLNDQAVGADFVKVSAESAVSGVGWTFFSNSGAYRGLAVRAGSGQNDVLTYEVQFHKEGIYKLYVRSRGFSTTTNAIYVPGGGNPEGEPNTIFDFSTSGVWEWRSESQSSLPYYVIDSSNVNRILSFRIRERKAQSEVDELFFGRIGGSFDQDAPYVHVQRPDGSVVFSAEDYDNLSGINGFSPLPDDLAQGRRVLQASASANGQLQGTANYRVKFHSAGNYLVYLRSRGTSPLTDSVFIPSALNANPDQVLATGNLNTWEWKLKCSGCLRLTVTSADLGVVRELRIGAREPNARFDSVVVVEETKSDAELDTLSGFWEAEAAFNATGVTPVNDPAGASDGVRVDFDAVGDQFTFTGIPQTDTLLVRYSLGTPTSRQASVYVNGVDVDTLVFSPTGAWSSYATMVLRGNFSGSVKLQIDPDDAVVNEWSSSASIDRLSLSDAGEDCYVASVSDFEEAADWADPGDTIVLGSGADLDDVLLVVPAATSGTPDRPITIRNENPIHTTFTRGSTLDVQGDYVTITDVNFGGLGEWEPCAADACEAAIVLRGDHNRVTETAFKQYFPYELDLPEVPPDYSQVKLRGYHNRVDHTRFDRHLNMGATIVAEGRATQGPHYPVIHRNHFRDRPDAQANGCEMIQALGYEAGSEFALISENYFENIMTEPAGEGEVISNKSADNRILYNAFSNVGAELTLRQSQRALVYGNFFFERGAIRVFGAGHVIVNNYFDVDQPGEAALIIANGNTLAGVKTQTDSCWRDKGYEVVENLVVAYNTFEVTPGTPIIQVGYEGTCLLPQNVWLVNNLSWGGGFIHYDLGDDPAGEAYEFSDFTSVYMWNFFQSATFQFAGETHAWPFSLSQVRTGFTVNDTRGVAVPFLTSLVKTDVDGQLRPSSPQLYDVGADEDTPGQVYVHPPDSATTGPIWF